MEAEKLREHPISASQNRPTVHFGVPRLFFLLSIGIGAGFLVLSGSYWYALVSLLATLVLSVWATARDKHFPVVLGAAVMSAIRRESLYSPFVIQAQQIRWKRK